MSGTWANAVRLAVVVLGATLAQPVRAAACDPRFVTFSGAIVTVLPTGTDDTNNLQCVFDSISGVPAAHVRLLEGEYRSSNVWAKDFNGTLAGAGDATVLTNTTLRFDPDWVVLGAPSREHPWAFFLTFEGGRFEVRDLAVAIRGARPSQRWPIEGIDIYAAVGQVLVLGTVQASFRNVSMSGEQNPDDPIYGYNAYNGIYFETPASPGAFPPGYPVASGSFAVRDSKFTHMASWFGISQIEDATVEVMNNEALDVPFAIDVGYVARSRLLYVGNRVQGAALTSLIGPFDASGLSLIANRFDAPIDVELQFSGGSTCAILANSTPAVTGETNLCLVAGNRMR